MRQWVFKRLPKLPIQSLNFQTLKLSRRAPQRFNNLSTISAECAAIQRLRIGMIRNDDRLTSGYDTDSLFILSANHMLLPSRSIARLFNVSIKRRTNDVWINMSLSTRRIVQRRSSCGSPSSECFPVVRQFTGWISLVPNESFDRFGSTSKILFKNCFANRFDLIGYR